MMLTNGLKLDNGVSLFFLLYLSTWCFCSYSPASAMVAYRYWLYFYFCGLLKKEFNGSWEEVTDLEDGSYHVGLVVR